MAVIHSLYFHFWLSLLCITLCQSQSISSMELDANDLFSSTSTYCTDQCIPGDFSRDEQCDYVTNCCDDTLGDVLFNYVNIQYCTFNSVQPFGVIILCLLLFYSFWMLGEVADEYFGTNYSISNTLSFITEVTNIQHP